MMRWLWLAIVAIFLDQVSKYLATEYLAYKPPMEITSWLNFILAHNMGAAFSFLGDAGGWQRWFFTALAGAASIFILIWLRRLKPDEHWLACALSLILGGAVGNLIDRVRFGYVVDFIDFHIGTWHFATFNIADAAISIGAVMMLIEAFFLNKDRSEKQQ